jgi:hypothetical protein
LKKWRKEKIFAVYRKLKRTAKTNGRLLQKWRKVKIFVVRPKLKRTAKNLCRASENKTHGKDSLPCVLYARQIFFAVRFVRRTAESFFAVRPIKEARQRFERTAKAAFPVVLVLKL